MEEFLRQALTILRGMWRRRWIGLAVAWAVALAGAIVVLRIPDRFEATARVFVDTQTVLKPLLTGLAVQPNVEEQISLLARTLISRPNLEKIMRSADLDVAANSQLERDRVVDALMQRIRFGGGRENIYSISYQDVNPERAKKVVQDLLSLFVESGVGNKRRDSEGARRFIDEQIRGYEKKLEEAENRVKEFKLKNLGFTGGAGQDYFTRMNALTEELAKIRLELRGAEQSRDALKRELSGEDPVMLPDTNVSSAGASGSEFDARIDAQRKQLDDLLRRFTDEHPDVAATKRLIAQLEEQKKQDIEARRKAAAQNPARMSASTNPVFQKIKISLAESEANVASLKARAGETEARLATLRAAAGRAPQIEAEMAQLNRDYDVLRKNYEQLVARRESASMSEDVDTSARMAEFRVIDPPRVAPKAVFPNRSVLLPLVLVIALGAGMAAAFAWSQIRPTFHDARRLREMTQRPVLGSVSMQETLPVIRARRKSNLLFAGSFASLMLLFGTWIGWVVLAARA